MSTERSKAVPLLSFFVRASMFSYVALYLTGCSLSLLLLEPREGCAS